ncbi:hypothetical protein [Pseudomonas sp. GM21]|uniref:hypothetical protein n=1 Tax=Pseudomonas sp. GM21 TaxID=1144325 RepID=UPI001EE64CEE|nr:hypothetical protein [Pseudomonas sp. GM21]
MPNDFDKSGENTWAAGQWRKTITIQDAIDGGCDPAEVAALIRRNPAWINRAQQPDHMAQSLQLVTTAQPPQIVEVNREPQHPIHTAATASPEWIAARDQYLKHLMTCRLCHAPTDRYCVIGAELRATYDRTPLESAP